MAYLTHITIIGFLAGIIGTAVGGAVSLIIRNPREKMVGALIAISGGIMLAVVFKDLVPEALEFGGIGYAFGGIGLGLTLMFALNALLPEPAHGASVPAQHARLLRTSLLLGLGIALHNFPEGLAIGAGFAASEHLGLGLAVVIALHNIPEGLAMAGPMRGAGVKAKHILLWTGLAGVPMGIGALAGAAMGGTSPFVLSLSLGFAAGAMLYIIFSQLLPDARRMASTVPAAYATVGGIALGLAMLHVINKF